MDAELIDEARQWAASGEAVAQATVVQAYGSAPRRAGSKMIVSATGQASGSVSGGCVEADVILHAQEVLRTGQPRLVPYGISDEQAFGVGLSCGGQIEVFVEPFAPASQAAEPLVLAKVIAAPEGLGTQLLVPSEGPALGDLSGAAPRAQVEADARGLLARLAASEARTYEGGVRVFFDVYAPPPVLVIFGAVHVGAALCRLASAVGFRVRVVDARGFFATTERFPDADEITIAHADDYLASHPLVSNAYVAVLSHDPKLDDPALAGALASKARYIGAVGSRKTHAERLSRLRQRGLSEEALARVRGGPVGLDLGAASPEEIALSILAEMVAAKNGRGL